MCKHVISNAPELYSKALQYTFGADEIRLYPWLENSSSNYIIGMMSLKADEGAISSAIVVDVATWGLNL